MLFTYPITYLDPTLYDDWETVFVGNHIYPRLLPEKDKPAVPFLTPAVSATCVEPAAPEIGPACRQLRLSFSPGAFSDCAGNQYQAEDVRREFEALLKAKSWALPGWSRCSGSHPGVCVTGKNTGDIQRRLQNVNFRFGWSKRKPGDTVFGAGPYCLSADFGPGKAMVAGALVPRKANAGLPSLEFSVGGGKDTDFQVSLYGTRDLLKDARRNVQAHTPLAYYVVTSPALARRKLPWNSPATRDLIRTHFVGRDVFFSETSGIEQLVPAGRALESQAAKRDSGRKIEFALPDYLPGCAELAATLTAAWSADNSAKAVCTNIVTFIQQRVREKNGRWSGFLVGLSPADPGRDALKLQYFSKDSPDSLTYDYKDPDELFYLAGIGQSLVTVDGRRVCDLRPNVLGLGDIFATDFLPCGR